MINLLPRKGSTPTAAPAANEPAWHGDPATDAQRRFIRSLREKHDDTGMGPTPEGDALTKGLATKAIDWLKGRPLKPAQTAPAKLEPGFYQHQAVPGTMTMIYRVVISESTGFPYVLVLDRSQEDYLLRESDPVPAKMQWDRGPRYQDLCKLDPEPLSLESVRKLGQIYMYCVYCNRELSDDRSTAVGYGPKCALNYGLPWGEEA